jgi:hypothetical protein
MSLLGNLLSKVVFNAKKVIATEIRATATRSLNKTLNTALNPAQTKAVKSNARKNY